MLADASVFGIAVCDIMKRNIRLLSFIFFASVYLFIIATVQESKW